MKIVDVRLRGGRAVALCLLVAAGSVWLTAQQSAPGQDDQAPPIFRAGTELIQVDVSVLDRRRRLVKGLTAADFTIYEDGQPRPVETFTEVDLPARPRDAEATWAAFVPPDVVSNQTVEQEGRIVIILLDRSIERGWPWASAKRVAAEAIEALGPNDLAAVLTGGGQPQNLTANRELLLRAVARADPSGVTSADAQALVDRIHQFDGRTVFSPLADGRCMCGACALQSITRAADAVSGIPSRRKLLLFIGASLVVQADPFGDVTQGCGFQLRDARKAMFDALERSNLTVHSLDPTGLEVWPAMRSTGDTMARMSRLDSLKILPDHTGGRSVGGNDPQIRVPDIFEESQSYYLLGFAPAPGHSEGRARSIDVRINRRGVRVQARRQYLVPTDTTTFDVPRDTSSRSVDDAMRSLLPVTHVPMDLHVASFANPGSRRAMVTVSASVGGFSPEIAGSDTETPTPFELVAGAYDSTGQPHGVARQKLELTWPLATSGASERRVEALSRLDLAPGHYEIRVAAIGTDAAHTSSVFTHVTAPDYATTPFSLSHIVFGAGAATSTVPPDFFDGVLPLPPTTQRTFARAGGVTAFLQMYQGTALTDTLQPVGVRVRIVDAQDRVARDEVLIFEPGEFAANRTANARLELPVRNLPAGEYLLRLEAMMGERVAGRAARFEVR